MPGKNDDDDFVLQQAATQDQLFEDEPGKIALSKSEPEDKNNAEMAINNIKSYFLGDSHTAIIYEANSIMIDTELQAVKDEVNKLLLSDEKLILLQKNIPERVQELKDNNTKVINRLRSNSVTESPPKLQRKFSFKKFWENAPPLSVTDKPASTEKDPAKFPKNNDPQRKSNTFPSLSKSSETEAKNKRNTLTK